MADNNEILAELAKKLSYGKIRRSSLPGKKPSAEKLDFGQLAINFADGKLFYKDVNGEIQEFNSKATPATQYIDAASGEQEYKIPLIIPVGEGEEKVSPIYASATVSYDPDTNVLKLSNLELDYLKIGDMVIDGVNNVVDFGEAETIILGNAVLTKNDDEETVLTL